MKIQFASIALFMSVSLPTYAADPTRDVQQQSNRTSAYAEIGLAFQTTTLPLVGFNDMNIDESSDTVKSLDITLDGRFQYKGFFVESIEESFSEWTAGYSVYDDDSGSVELIVTQLFGGIERNDIAGLESIEDRKADINLGVRGSYFFNDSLVQLELVRDVRDSHNGFIGAVHVGRQKQLLNWNLYGLAGLRYFSPKVIDHLFGVSADEATELAPEYQADSGVLPSLQLGAILPLSENWTFNVQAEYSRLPDSVSESPLAQGNDFYITRVGFNYVFFN